MIERKAIEIEDTSDCATCTARDDSDLDLMRAVKVRCLGKVPCHECGREYEAIAAESDCAPQR